MSLSGLAFSEKTGTLTSTPRATTAGPVGRGAYRVDVKVGRMQRTDIRRLQVLPQRSTAKLLFLGVRDGGHSVSFLNLDHREVRGGAVHAVAHRLRAADAARRPGGATSAACA